MFHVKHLIEQISITGAQIEDSDRLLEKHKTQLEEYANHLLWWNSKVNLISRDVSHETLANHIRHSLLIGSTTFFRQADHIIDTGSGGGLPGIPLAICFPEKTFLINDIVTKKVMAVKNMAQKLALNNVEVFAGSVENAPIKTGDLVITKHAFKVNQLVDYLIEKEWSKIVFLKGAEEGVEEINKTVVSLDATIYKLDHSSLREFYLGKSIIEVAKK